MSENKLTDSQLFDNSLNSSSISKQLDNLLGEIKPVKPSAGQGSRRPRGQKSTEQKQKPPTAKTPVSKPPTTKQQPAKQTAAKSAPKTKTSATKQGGSTLKIIPLGGLGEIGKNITCFEYEESILLVDCGLAFPDPDMLGVDIVIPDFTYLEQNRKKIKGLVITHGHEDHIGSIPYLLKKISVPVYGTRLTLGLIEGKLKEHGLLGQSKLNVCKSGDTLRFGKISVELIGVNHSIPDANGLAIHTPAGTVVHTGDFKVDFTPIEGEIINLAKFSELGRKGVLALMSDSTNAERPGFAQSESKVGESFEKLFTEAGKRRIVVASFSSNIHRVQQIMNAAHKHGRKVALSGRSMENVTEKAIELGYLKLPKQTLIPIGEIKNYSAGKLCIITTGSQGEPLSALSRMAGGDHKHVNITENDFIIISATPIPGNEKHVTRIVNELMKLGAKVIYEKMYEVHVSGHACQDELKMILSLCKPQYFIPVHGEYKHLKRHAELAQETGISPANIFVGEIGQVFEFKNGKAKIKGTVPAGKVFVDGSGIGDVGTAVIRDRKALSTDGLIVVTAIIDKKRGRLVSKPEIISRGFVYQKESEQLIEELSKKAEECIADTLSSGKFDAMSAKGELRGKLAGFINKKTRRTPVIIPVVVAV